MGRTLGAREGDLTLSKAADKVIELARKIRDYYDSELPKWHPDYPVVDLMEEGPPPPPEEADLRAFLESLPKATIDRLILIMYLGRGDFGTDDLAGSYEYFKRMFRTPRDAARQMLEKTPLGDYLSDGMEELRKHGIDANRLPLGKVKLRKP